MQQQKIGKSFSLSNINLHFELFCYKEVFYEFDLIHISILKIKKKQAKVEIIIVVKLGSKAKH